MTKAVKLTDAEKTLLCALIAAMEASEWDAGDYCFTQSQFDALLNAKRKLQE